MKPQLNHLVVWAQDGPAAAAFIGALLGLDAPTRLGRFSVLEAGNGVSVDFATGEPVRAHLAFLVTEREFDAIFDRIVAAGLAHWADPGRSQPGRINHKDGGRGVYFSDPHSAVGWEVLTRPYGSGPRPAP